MTHRIEGRAHSAEEKRAVVERILAVWERTPELRLGQLLYASVGDVFYTEDEQLADAVESYAKRVLGSDNG